MKIQNIETARLILRGFTKEDALWAYSIWNNPEMGQYLPDEAKEEIDEAMNTVEPQFIEILKEAAENITLYHKDL